MAVLGNARVAGVLRAADLERAKKFYTEVLGLTIGEPAGQGGMAMFMAGSGTAFTVYENPGLPAPENTTLGFAVSADQFDALMAELRSKGVTFQDYDIPEMGLKTVNGVAQMGGTKSAWFKDTEGNILNIVVM